MFTLKLPGTVVTVSLMFSKHLSMLDLPLPILPSTLTTNGFVLVSCSMTFAVLKESPKVFVKITLVEGTNASFFQIHFHYFYFESIKN